MTRNHAKVFDPKVTRCAGVLLLAVLVFLAACARDPAARKQKYLESGNRYFDEKRFSEAAIQYRNALQVDRGFAEAYYRLGITLSLLGQWADAAQAFARAVQLAPDNVDARVRLGGILARAGQFAEARNEIEAALKQDPKNASAHLVLGQMHLQQKRYPDAKNEFQQAMDLAPHDPMPYANLALVQLLAGEFDGAEKNFQKAVELQPSEPQFVINLANFYRSQQKSDRAEQALREAMGRNPKAIALPLAVADLFLFQDRAAEAKRLLDQLEANDRDFPEGRRLVADFYFLRNDSPAALERYLALAKRNDRDQELIKHIAECYLRLARWNEAEQWIGKGSKKNKDPEFRLLRARAYLGEYRVRDAISELRSLINEAPSMVGAHYTLGQAYFQKGDLRAAKDALTEATRVQPGYLPGLLGLAELSLQERDSAVALQYASEIISQSYWVAGAHLIAGNAHLLRGDLAAALKEFDVAAGLNPRSALSQERRGRVFAARGRYAEAEKAYEQALATDPGYADALAGLVHNFLRQGRADRARARIEQQIRRQPSSYQLEMVKGEFCVSQKDWDCAEQSFRRALQLYPYAVRAYAALARVYSARNRLMEAVREYEQARQKFPDYLPNYVVLGLAYEARGDYERAKQVCQDALKIDANFAPAQNNLAWLYVKHGGPLNEALELAQRAKVQRPDDPHISDTLAWIYYKQGLYPSAVELLESTVAKNPEAPVFQFHLGMAYLAQGKQHQGRKALQTALRLGLNAEDAKVAREALRGAG